jgi:NAD(P)-dependent dehydrogenase (short-subunit alcohol dehydrogenase family)
MEGALTVMASRSSDLPPFRPDLLAGRTAIVTGGGTGIGRGIALALAAVGANVVIASRRHEHLTPTADEIMALGGAAETSVCDIRDPEAVERTMELTEERFGRVDLLVNNAGATFTKPAEELSLNGWRAVIDIDIHGTWHCTQAAGRRMIRDGGGGAILNITSTSPVTGNPGRIHGGVGKAGVDSMTKSLAVEWARYGIRVNAIAPGLILTEGVERAIFGTEGELERRSASVPLGRLGTVDEIGTAAVFLLSDAAAYITGATLVVDGGRWLSSGRGMSGE